MYQGFEIYDFIDLFCTPETESVALHEIIDNSPSLYMAFYYK